MIRSLAGLWLLVMVAAAGGCISPPVPPPAPAPQPAALPQDAGPVDWRVLVGCWRMSADWVFALDSLPAINEWILDHGPDARRARTFPVRQRQDVFWSVTPRNTIQLIISNGLHGSRSEFVFRDGRLVGQQWTISDVVIPGTPPRAPREVVAVRERCPAAASQDSHPPSTPTPSHLRIVKTW